MRKAFAVILLAMLLTGSGCSFFTETNPEPRWTQGQWKSLKADAAAKIQDMHDRVDRKRDEHDVKKAERDAQDAEEDAADALDYATWVIDQAQVAVLYAIDARTWADEQAAASPPR